MSGKSWSRYEGDTAGFGRAASFDSAAHTRVQGNRGPLVLAVGVGVFLLFFAIVWQAFSQSGGTRPGGMSGPPVIQAEEGPFREAALSQPVVRTPNSDLAVYDAFNARDESARADASLSADEPGDEPGNPADGEADTELAARDAAVNTGAVSSVPLDGDSGRDSGRTSGQDSNRGTSLASVALSAGGRTAGTADGSSDRDSGSRNTGSRNTEASNTGSATGRAGNEPSIRGQAQRDSARAGGDDGTVTLQQRLEGVRAATARSAPASTSPPTSASTGRPSGVGGDPLRGVGGGDPALALSSNGGLAAVLPSRDSDGLYAVQIASFRTRGSAETAWARMSQRFPEMLGVRDPEIVFADLKERGVRYRVRMPGFADRRQALAYCEVLKELGQDCIVMRR